MRKNFKKVVVLLLAVAVLMSAATVNFAASSSSTSSSVNKKDTYNIDVFTMLGNFSGDQTGWGAKILKDKFNMKMNLISSNVEGGGDTKFYTMMASGNLGDLVIFGDDADGKYQQAIKAGMLLDWNKDNLLTKYAPYITKNYAKVIQKNKTNFGSGKSVYGLGYIAADAKNSGPSEGTYFTEETDLRYDVWKKAGSPKLNKFEDLIPVLKKMVTAEPKSLSGKKTYGFSFFKDWDGNMMMFTKAFTALMGYDEGDGLNDGGFMQFNPNGASHGALELKGPYVRVLKILNKAYQQGLVDPDSITQTFNDLSAKYGDGQVMFSLFPWMCGEFNTAENKAKGMGYILVPVKEAKHISYAFNPYGSNRLITIGAKAKNPERIIDFINWLYTPEGFQTSKTGPEGLAWTMKNGKPVLTAFGKKSLPGKEEPVPANYGGGDFKNGFFQMNIDPIEDACINPTFKEPYDYTLWSSESNTNVTALEKDWRNTFKALNSADYLIKNKLYALKKPVFTGKAAETQPDTLKQKQGQVKAVIIDTSWKCIYAKSDADFNSTLSAGVAKAKGLGYNEVVKWNLDHARQVQNFLKTVK